MWYFEVAISSAEGIHLTEHSVVLVTDKRSVRDYMEPFMESLQLGDTQKNLDG